MEGDDYMAVTYASGTVILSDSNLQVFYAKSDEIKKELTTWSTQLDTLVSIFNDSVATDFAGTKTSTKRYKMVNNVKTIVEALKELQAQITAFTKAIDDYYESCLAAANK